MTMIIIFIITIIIIIIIVKVCGVRFAGECEGQLSREVVSLASVGVTVWGDGFVGECEGEAVVTRG